MIKYGLLTADDEMASEHEVYDFLYGLVRLLKPKVILETGCYKGGATKSMARAARKNGIGKVFSCDTDYKLTADLLLDREQIGLPMSVNICTGHEHANMIKDVDFAFIDSSGDRVAEVNALQLSPNAVVVLHDSNRPQYKPIWTIKPWKSIWHIATEQGITVFQL